MRILVLTPIDDEFTSLTEALGRLGFGGRERAIGSLSCYSYDDGELIVAPGGLGKAQFAVQTQFAIDRLPDRGLVVCAGTAGGLERSLAIGDVVVATETIEHDFRWGMKTRPLPRFRGDPGIVTRLESTLSATDHSFDIHFGAVASGDEGIINPDRATELKRATGALAVAWEGAGGARAAKFSNLPFLEIRGISDGAGDGAPAEFEANLPHTMGNVAVMVSDLVGLLRAPKVDRIPPKEAPSGPTTDGS